MVPFDESLTDAFAEHRPPVVATAFIGSALRTPMCTEPIPQRRTRSRGNRVCPDAGEPEMVSSPPRFICGKKEVDTPFRSVHVPGTITESLLAFDSLFQSSK